MKKKAGSDKKGDSKDPRSDELRGIVTEQKVDCREKNQTKKKKD